MIASNGMICDTASNRRPVRRKGVSEVTKPLIAIIEDDDSMRPALVGLMRSLGYDGEGFASAEAFLAGNAASRATCLVSDFQLPGLSGLDLAAQFKNRLPVIMVTARTEPGIDTLAAENGVLCVLRKPFEADDLAAWICCALDRKQPLLGQGHRGDSD
jgi:FixJ family two-component response regulator